MAKVKVSMTLPKVGDHLRKIPVDDLCSSYPTYIPKDCVVTYVNSEHGWYEVEFVGSRIRECFGLPIVDHSIVRSWGSIPVLCVETGYAYSSVVECARDMGIEAGNISRQLCGDYDHYRGYHFVTVL